MKLLLDTHAFIWWDSGDARLSAAALAACKSPANSLHLSLASVWEMQIKMQLGKLTLRLPLAEVLRDEQQRNGIMLEPVELEDILALETLQQLHRDPFDRLLGLAGDAARLLPREPRPGNLPLSGVHSLMMLQWRA